MGSGIGGEPGVGSGIGGVGWLGSIGVMAGTSSSERATRGEVEPMPEDPAHQAEAEYVEENDTEWADGTPPNTFPSGETVKADRRDAQAPHEAGRGPTPDEEAKAEDHPVDPHVAESYRAATARGAHQEGEGRLP